MLRIVCILFWVAVEYVFEFRKSMSTETHYKEHMRRVVQPEWRSCRNYDYAWNRARSPLDRECKARRATPTIRTLVSNSCSSVMLLICSVADAHTVCPWEMTRSLFAIGARTSGSSNDLYSAPLATAATDVEIALPMHFTHTFGYSHVRLTIQP